MYAKKVARYGLLLALALVLSYAESLVPLSVAVPGVKLGLPNLAVLFALYRLGEKDAVTLSILRVVLVSILFGNAYSLWYSLAGAVLSLGAMIGLKKLGFFGKLGVSVAGGVCHNLGQIAVAILVLRSTAVIYYLPVLLLSGTLAGIAIGAVGAIMVERVKL